MGKIVCVGSANVDIVATAKHLPVGGETVMGSALSFGPGGKGSNQVTAAHRAGAELVFVTRIGDDPLAATLTEHYKKDGISMKYVEVVPGAVTSTALIEVDGQTAQNSIVVVAPLLETISAADVERAEAEFASADVVLVQYETSVESILAAKALAKKYHKTFVVNPAPFREMPEGFYDGVDLLTPNETEAGFLTGVKITDTESAVAAGAKLAEMGVGAAVITLGKNGALYTDGKESVHVPGLSVKAVDTTGAGDSFNGGLCTALSEGADMKTALQFANCTGALSVTKHGAASAAPTRVEILTLMKKTYGTEL